MCTVSSFIVGERMHFLPLSGGHSEDVSHMDVHRHIQYKLDSKTV